MSMDEKSTVDPKVIPWNLLGMVGSYPAGEGLVDRLQLKARRTPDGRLLYPASDVAWIIQETKLLLQKPDLRNHPDLTRMLQAFEEIGKATDVPV